MPIAIDDFWKLTIVSGLLTAERARELQRVYGQSGGSTTDPAVLAQWLVAQNVLSRYQATVLLAGRPGPFVLGDFVIRDRVEQGRLQGMFRARYRESHTVLLVFLAQLTDVPDAEALLEPRVQAAMAIRHPHISRTHRLIARGAPFIVTQDLKGQSLRESLAQANPSSAALCRMFRDVAEGLAEMHARSVAHGNVSLDSIWQQADGTALLLQFPLSIDLRGPLPAASEYIAAEGPILTAQMAHDVTALGAALFEALAKHPAHSAVEPLSRAAANIPPGLGRLVDGLLGGHPYTAAQFAKALDDFASEDAAVTLADPSALPPETDWLATVSAAQRKRAPRRLNLSLAITATIALAVATGLGFWIFSSSPKNSDSTPSVVGADGAVDPATAAPGDGGKASPEEAAPAVAAVQPVPAAQSSPATMEVDDDGQTLWASPTQGEPLSLEYLPAGARLYLAIRWQAILAEAEGARLITALGPAGEQLQEQLPATLGVPLREVEQMTAALYTDDADAVQTAFVVGLSKPRDVDDLLRGWKNPTPREHEGKTFYAGTQLAYYLPGATDDGKSGQTLVIAPPAAMPGIVEQTGPAPLPTVLAQLARATDRTRHIQLLFAPSFLFTDGRAVWQAELVKLRDPFRQFLGDNLQAGLLSAHLGDRLFLELRAVPAAGSKPLEVATQLRDRVNRMPEQVEEFVASHDFPTYGRLVLNRFPRMLQALSQLTRSGVEDRQAVLRCYLPARAAHNLVLGTQLALTQAGTANANPPVAPGQPAAPRDATAALRRAISLSFPRESLENCLELLSQEIGVPIEIMGPDFQAEGITRNQSLNDFDERDQPADLILRKLLLKANPEGKLVYLLKVSPSGVETLAITTRRAAAARNDRLPAEFSEKSPAKSP